MKIRTRKTELFDNIYIGLLFTYVLSNGMISGTTVSECELIYKIFIYIEQISFIFLCCVVATKLTRNVTINTIYAFIIILLGLMTAAFGHNQWILVTVMIICGMRGVDIEKAVEKIYIASLISFMLVMLMAVSGIISDYTIATDGVIRHSYGYSHPNTLGAIVLKLVLMKIYLKRESIKMYDCVIVELLAVTLYIISRSRTSIFLLAIMGLLLAVKIIMNRRGALSQIITVIVKNSRWLFIAIPIFSTIVIISYFDNIKNYFSGTVYSRAYQSLLYFNTYGISLFGQELEINNTSIDWKMYSDLYTLDNGYMFLLLGFGIITFILYIIGQIYLSRIFIIDKQYICLFILLIYLIYGFMETSIIRFTYNFTLLFLSIPIWGTKGNVKTVKLFRQNENST